VSERAAFRDGAASVGVAGAAQQRTVGVERRMMGQRAGRYRLHVRRGRQARGHAETDRRERPQDDHGDRHGPEELRSGGACHVVDLPKVIAQAAVNRAVTAVSRNASAVPWAKSALMNVVL
jgi:hypothetical protein